jgi:hypothetical protein
MTETRYIEEYDGQGNVLNRIPYTVDDITLKVEALAHAGNEQHLELVRAYKNWATLTTAQKETVLKAMLRFYILHELEFIRGLLGEL